ncbi:TPM domain-containing protein [Solitalea lacus]|uniref:TPM domain-containing protein n=1 Tax=Solitalea lacus TaxID=2911172 RepID=UPI001EDBCB81|nr:TPM domain-containing protein [Solitalea lacus]UKJ08429.1 TPM domain-containing protein [Solitalea lacus]
MNYQMTSILAMNKLKGFFLFFFLFLSFLVVGQDIPEKPNPPRLVNDYTQTLTTSQKDELERKLVAYNDSTSNQIAVVIVQSLNGYEIADYAIKLGQKWGVGQKEKRNGVVLLVSMGDRKVFIAVGYGLEGAIPDAYAKRITSTIIKPEFKAGNYFKGINDGTDAIMKFASGEYTVGPDDVVSNNKGGGSGGVLFVVFLIFGLIIIFSLLRRKRYQHIANRGAGSDLPFWVLMSMLGNSGRNSGNNDWGDFSGGGGDFGGFGGGDFGGGGAGDSW